MRDYYRQFCSALGLFVIMLASTFAAAVNEAPLLTELSLLELLQIRVTVASKFTEIPLDIGSVVSVISSDYWQARGARRLEDALGFMPGLVALPHFLGVKQFAVRGFTSTNGSGIQTLWDGVPINTYPVGTAQLDHPDIQLNTLKSIEVIRGPGSAIYGSEAFHGVVSLTAYESQVDEQQFSLRASTNGYYDGYFRFSAAVPGDWRLNLAVATNGQPDQDFSYKYLSSGTIRTSKRDYQFDSSTASIKLASAQTGKIAYKFGFYYNNYSHSGFFHSGGNVPANDTSDLNSRLTMAKVEVQWQLDNQSSITLDASYWTEEHDFHRILSPANNQINIIVDEETQASTSLTYRNADLLDNTQLSVAFNHRNNAVKNAFRTVTTAAGTEILNAPLFFGFKSRTIDSLMVDAKSQFADGRYILRYGFRYDNYNDFGSHLSPRLGLIRKFGNASAIKLLYGHAFRAPTGNELFGAPFIKGNEQLDPEVIDTIELVYLRQGDSSKFEAVLFESKWKDTILVADNKYKNITDSRSYGVELSYAGRFGKWILDVNGSYVESRNETDKLDFVVFPKYIVNLNLGYSFRNNWSVRLNNRIHLDVSRHPDSVVVTSEKLKDYWRLDLNVTKKYGMRSEFFANIRNLFNRDNQLPSTLNSTALIRANFIGGIQDEKINADIGFRYTF